MRPIGFHTIPRALLRVGQRAAKLVFCAALLVAGAVASVLYSPFLIGGWIMDRLQKLREEEA